jgi:addiction module HigA family antidote
MMGRLIGWNWSSTTERRVEQEMRSILMAGKFRREPSHPGTLLREVVLPAMRVSVAEAARELGVSRQQLYKILRNERAVTAEMATRLGRYCGNGPELWLNMQSNFDLWHVERDLAKELEKIPTRAAV